MRGCGGGSLHGLDGCLGRKSVSLRVSFITRQVLPSHMLCLSAGTCGVLLFWSFFEGGVDSAQLGILGILARAVGGMC